MIDYSNSDLYIVRGDEKKVVLRREGKYWFGPFRISHFYDIEKSEDVVRNKKTRETMESVEFVCVREKGRLTFVEVKNSLPQLTLKKNFTLRLGQRVKMENTPQIITEQLATFWNSLSKLPQRFEQSTDMGIIPENVMDKLEAFSDSLSNEFLKTIEPLWIIPRSVHEICDKFINSWRLLLSVAYGRETSDDISPEILNYVRNPETPIRFLLIVDIEEQIKEANRQKINSLEGLNDSLPNITNIKRDEYIQDPLHTFLTIANTSVRECLNEYLNVDRLVCKNRQIDVMDVSTARKNGWIASEPI